MLKRERFSRRQTATPAPWGRGTGLVALPWALACAPFSGALTDPSENLTVFFFFFLRQNPAAGAARKPRRRHRAQQVGLCLLARELRERPRGPDPSRLERQELSERSECEEGPDSGATSVWRLLCEPG